MDWLIPIIVANILIMGVLTGVYLYLRIVDQKVYLGIWAAAWALVGLRFIFVLWMQFKGESATLLLANQAAALLGGYVLFRGSNALLGRKLSMGWLAALGIGIAWIAVAALQGASWVWISLPAFTFLALVYVFTGLIFLNSKDISGKSARILGIAFVAWGLLKVLFPFLRPFQWFQPWGYTLEALFGLFVAIFTILMYFQEVRADLVKSEQRLQTANSKLVEAQATLQVEKDFEENLVNTASAVILVLDMQGKILRFNHYVEEMTGYTLKEVEGQDWFNIFVPESGRDVMRSSMTDSLELDRVIKCTVPILTRDGRLIEIEWSNRMLRDSQGSPIGLLSIGMDITERLKNEEKIRRQLEMMESLHAIDSSITSGDDLNITLRLVVNLARTHLWVDAADILILDKTEEKLRFATGHGFRSQKPETLRHPRENGLAWQVLQTGQQMEFRMGGQVDEETARDFMEIEGFQTYIGLPLVTKGKVKGVIEIYHRTMLDYNQDWMGYLVTLAGQAAVALENATLIGTNKDVNSDLIFAYDNTIEGWARTLELRDLETEGHSQRVVDYTLVLAVRMGFRGEALVQIRRGALLHDIGKMGIPDSILLKNGPLKEDEWAIMRRHPQYAYDLLFPIDFLRQALVIPYCHHERWDGSGYPRGLKGEEIPLEARIFTVTDVWDALNSDRPYRPKWEEERVLKYLQEQSGLLFDPQVVDVFINILEMQNSRMGTDKPAHAGRI